MGAGELVPNNTAKVKFSVNVDHTAYQAAVGGTIPTNDSLTNDDYTFDEIGLMAGVTNSGALDKTKTLMMTHVTFHPVLLSANRTIVIDYTVTIQIS